MRIDSITTGGDLTVKVSANISILVYDDKVRHQFLYVENGVGTKQKLWRYYGSILLSDSTPVLTNGDSEGVIKVNSTSDFSGGVHGDEEFTDVYFYIDGTQIDMTIDGTYVGNKLTRMYNTEILTKDITPREVDALRNSVFCISKGLMYYDMSLTFSKILGLSAVYMGMSSISKEFTDVFNETGLSTPISSTVDSNGYWCENIKEGVGTIKTSIVYNQVPTGFENKLRVFGSTPYNKVYFGMLSQLNVVVGDVISVRYTNEFNLN